MVFVDSSQEQQRRRLAEPGDTRAHQREIELQLGAVARWRGRASCARPAQ